VKDYDEEFPSLTKAHERKHRRQRRWSERNEDDGRGGKRKEDDGRGGKSSVAFLSLYGIWHP
jgi:hypothetical protein